jgi:hypothetical protein
LRCEPEIVAKKEAALTGATSSNLMQLSPAPQWPTSNSTQGIVMACLALKENFREAGSSGRLSSWQAEWHAKNIGDRQLCVDPTELIAAHLDGMRERARRFLASSLQAVGDIAGLAVEGPIEWTAEAADLPPEDIVDIVSEMLPEASCRRGREQMLSIAEIERHTYHRGPAKKKRRGVGRYRAGRPVRTIRPDFALKSALCGMSGREFA